MFLFSNVNNVRFFKLRHNFKCLRFFSNDSGYITRFPHSYSLNEEETILERLNACPINEFHKYSVSTVRAKRIVAHRKKYGEFKDLHQVLMVEGFGFKVLKSLCDSILRPISDELPVRKPKNFHLTTPDVMPDVAQGMQLVVGVAIGTLCLSWAGIEVSTNNVIYWDYHNLSLSSEVKRHHETHIFEAAYDAFKMIPSADSYVMESCIASGVQQSANIPVNQQRLQLSSMLLVLLNQGHEERGRVFYQRNALWCRLYGTLVGSERVSSQHVVENLLSDACGPHTPLHPSEGVLETYLTHTPQKREAMNAALLLTTSFLDLNVRRKPECLAALRGRSKKS